MKCKYCDVNDAHYNLAESNGKIREAIINGDYAQNIISKFAHLQNEMQEFSLWGLEPSINFDVADKLLIPLYDYFHNANRLSYSSNCGLGYKPHDKLISVFENYSRPITIDIQLSTDGPDWITSETRQVNANKKVLEVAEYIERISRDLKNVTLTAHFKPTLDITYMKQLVYDDKKFEDYFRYFKDYAQYLNSIGPVHFAVATPTLVVPHYHTVEDGKIFARFMHKINQRDLSQIYFMQTYDRYLSFIHSEDSPQLCSAGLYTASVDYQGNLYGCHNLFKLNYDNNREASVYDGHSSLGTLSFDRIVANQELIHHYFDTAKMNFTSLIITLADAGQIDKKYAIDARWRDLLITIIGGVYCPFGQLSTTKSVWIPTTSYLKLFGNGALEELVIYFEKVREHEGN